ncbi:hypothetical protein F5B22DRAFT_627307 [Xylaria bambusicola]|uniref:uncharacterized protein n=1 Tax=Xylaria bambusicola TaxID=326684 RepID=UPI0020077E55|nr:uncharacterized protein F5B22DRAFT_627307 [Xylaria bambusicola]KAI0505529.1 hypothetical protein F5B22DRAFT_627307 [Xylaria bambusicola]
MSRSTPQLGQKGTRAGCPAHQSNFSPSFFSFYLAAPNPFVSHTTDAPFSCHSKHSGLQAHIHSLSTLSYRCCHSFLGHVHHIVRLSKIQHSRLQKPTERRPSLPKSKMHAPSLFVLAASALSAVAQTTTSTLYMTATVTITQCAPTNTDCPLYTPPPSTSSTLSTSSYPVLPSSSSSSSPSSSSSFSYSSFSSYSYPVKTTTSIHYSANSTAAQGGSTSYPTGSVPVSYPTLGSTSGAATSSSPASTSIPATAGAGSLAIQSSLLAVLGIGALLMA